MDMTKEQLEARIKELETNRETVRTSFFAVEGAIQDCNYWLQQLNAPAETEAVKNTKAIKN